METDNQKQLYIRTDMNDTIATGHMMRCISIANAAAKLGVKVSFLCADDNAQKLVTEQGHDFINLKSNWQEMEEELPQLLDILQSDDDKEMETVLDEDLLGNKKRKDRWLLVDHYYVTEEYFRALKESDVSVCYLDDLGQCVYDVEALICYANYYKRFSYEDNYESQGIWPKFLLGCRYAPLRDVFANVPPKNIGSKMDSIMLMSGGADPCGMIAKILRALVTLENEEGLENLVINVICGNYYPNFEELVRVYENDSHVVLHQGVSNMHEFMKEADLAISAGGTTLYELSACGTPSISFSIADNQLNNVDQFDEDHIIACAGDGREDDVAANVLRIMNAYKDVEDRAYRSSEMQKLVDGKGAYHIVEDLFGI